MRTGHGGRCRRLPQFGIVANLFPFLPAVALAVDVDRIPDPEDERRQGWRSSDRERKRQCQKQALQFGSALEMKRRASYDARLNYHRLGVNSLFQKLYIQPTETACNVSPVKQAPAASLQSVVTPWPLAPRS